MFMFGRVAVLAVVAVPALASAHPDDCPALRVARLQGDVAKETVPLTSIFKCYADSYSYPAALAGLAGKLSPNADGVEGVVTFADTDYYAYVSRPFTVSGPSFYNSDGRYFACVTVQSSDVGAPGGQVAASVTQTYVNADRLLLASVNLMEQEGDDADSQDALPLQARNPHGLPKPQPTPFENTPEGVAEGRKQQEEKASRNADKKDQDRGKDGKPGHTENKGSNADKRKKEEKAADAAKHKKEDKGSSADKRKKEEKAADAAKHEKENKGSSADGRKKNVDGHKSEE